MKIFKNAAKLGVAAALALVLAACGSAEPAPSGSDGEGGVVPFANASGATVTLTDSFQEGSVDVTLAEGEALIIMSDLPGNENETTVVTTKDGSEVTTDYFYMDYGYSETGLEPGDYTSTVNGQGATGTIWVLAYPADQFDVMTMDAEEIIDAVLSNVS